MGTHQYSTGGEGVKTIGAALAVGLVGMLIVPASIIAMNLNEQQLDKLIAAGVGICGGSILLVFLTVGVVLAARFDERRKQREMGWGPTIEAPRESWQQLPPQPSGVLIHPQQQVYQLPPPGQVQQTAYHQQTQPAGYSYGGRGGYDLMPEIDQDERFKFAG
jgi:hypothetical protein